MSRTYSYGHVLTSEVRLIGANWTPSFYGLDGHGSVRFLTNLSGNVTDAYDYDAFGMSIHLLGPTPNAYLSPASSSMRTWAFTICEHAT